MTCWDTIATKVATARRLEHHEALWLLRHAPLLPLGQLADGVRRRRHPAGRVTFVVDANPNYTNICDTYCGFCSFYRRPGDPEGYVHDVASMVARARSAKAQGATRILLQGGHNPSLGMDYYLGLIRGLRQALPELELHLFSAPEVRAIAGFTGQTVRQVLEAFWAAGLRTLPGGGAEVLSDRVRRRLSPLKGTPKEWLDILRTAHQIGFRTTATLMYGHVEEDEDIVEHLLRLRSLQDEALAARTPRPESPAESRGESEPGSFFAFIPWSFKPGAAPLSRWVPEEAGGARYLRILAVSRLVLDNFPHIQASWFSEGEKTGALALRFGADDFGGTLIEENVLKAANHTTRTTTDRVVRLIRAAGYTPVERNTTYEPLRIYQGDAA